MVLPGGCLPWCHAIVSRPGLRVPLFQEAVGGTKMWYAAEDWLCSAFGIDINSRASTQPNIPNRRDDHYWMHCSHMLRDFLLVYLPSEFPTFSAGCHSGPWEICVHLKAIWVHRDHRNGSFILFCCAELMVILWLITHNLLPSFPGLRISLASEV